MLGGMIPGNNEPIPVVECYDIETNTLTTKADMPLGKRNFGCVIFGDYIYTIGGNGNAAKAITYDSIERYDYKNDVWETLKMTMKEPRANFVCEVVNNKIYCIGGTNNKNNTVATNEVLIVR